jgi:pimeloyl-ACP methyl ester carboxylesterase
MSLPRSLHIEANELVHRVLAWEPSGPAGTAELGTVMLLHGFMDAAGTWDLVAPALAAAGHRVLALDLRGFGDGARAPRGSYYHFADYVFDVADVVEQVAPEGPTAVVGHSMGGTVATLYAGTHPERVTRLVNIEGLGPPDMPPELAPVRMRAWIDGVRRVRGKRGEGGSFSRAEALRRLGANHPGVPPELLASRLVHLAAERPEDGEDRVAWKSDPLHRTTSPVPFFAPVFIAFARRVTCPVLFVSGGPKGFHPEDELERLAAFADLRRVEIEDAGHMVHWTRPEALAAHLAGFLR